MTFQPNLKPIDIEKETGETADDYLDSLFASPEAATKLDDRAALRKSLETIGLPAPTDSLIKVMDLDADGKKQIADGILKKMFIFRSEEITWDMYFKEAPFTLEGVEGRETLEAMKEIHRILVIQ